MGDVGGQECAGRGHSDLYGLGVEKVLEVSTRTSGSGGRRKWVFELQGRRWKMQMLTCALRRWRRSSDVLFENLENLENLARAEKF